jgi:hypothetical protein
MHVGGIICNLAKALDCVNDEILLTKTCLCVITYGIRGISAKWFRSYVQKNKSSNKII